MKNTDITKQLILIRTEFLLGIELNLNEKELGYLNDFIKTLSCTPGLVKSISVLIDRIQNKENHIVKSRELD